MARGKRVAHPRQHIGNRISSHGGVSELPTGLDHSGNLAVERELPETQAANPELAQIAARPSASPATVAMPDLELRLSQIFGDLGGCGHSFSFIAGTASPCSST